MRITEAKTHDKNFLKDINVPKYSMLVFNKAYNYYQQFSICTNDDIYFVTRQKKNAVYEVIKKVASRRSKKDTARVLKEEVIEVSYKMGE